MNPSILVMIMAALVPIIAIAGVILTKRTDEVESFALRFGVVAVIGGLVAFFTHLGVAFGISGFVCGLALLGYFFKLRHEMA